jgi:hypothetical protein
VDTWADSFDIAVVTEVNMLQVGISAALQDHAVGSNFDITELKSVKRCAALNQRNQLVILCELISVFELRRGKGYLLDL